MPLRLTEEQVETFYVLARNAGKRERSNYVQTGRLLSGTDVAEAPFYGMLRWIWIGLSKGTPIKIVIARWDEAWREYARENNAKVDAALKIQCGPSSGLSTIGHRWVSPEMVQAAIPHIYSMYRQIMKPETVEV